MGQLMVIFDEDGSGHAFAGYVKDTDFDVAKKEVVVRTKKLITYATLHHAFDKIGLNGINMALIETAAMQSAEISYLKREEQKARSREEKYPNRQRLVFESSCVLCPLE